MGHGKGVAPSPTVGTARSAAGWSRRHVTIPQEWPRVKELFEAARVLPADARPEFLAAACGGDDGLRHEVETLLVSHEGAASFLETPALLAEDASAVRSL